MTSSSQMRLGTFLEFLLSEEDRFILILIALNLLECLIIPRLLVALSKVKGFLVTFKTTILTKKNFFFFNHRS